MKIIKIIILSFISLSSLQGCMVAAVGAGVGAVKWGNAKKMEAKSQCRESYNKYLNLMIKNHKKPMSIEEYCSQ